MLIETNSVGAAFPSELARQSGNGQMVTGLINEMLVSKGLPDYYTLLALGKVFAITLLNANPTSYTGAAAGTPLLALYNPSGSNVNAVPLFAAASVRTTGSAAGNVDVALWQGIQGSTAPTGTTVVPTSQLTLRQAGSQMTAWANSAMTGAAAMTLLAPIMSIGAAGATAALNAVQALAELKGIGTTFQNNMLALACPVTLTAAAFDVSLIWAELPA